MKRIVVFVLVMLALLVVRYTHFYLTKPVLKPGMRISFYHTFWKEPRATRFQQIFTEHELRIVAPRYPELRYGDVVRVSGLIEEVELQTKEGDTVRVLAIPNPRITPIEPSNMIVRGARFIRNRVQDSFERALGRNESGLIVGVVLGGKQGLSSDFYQQLVDTGVVHVVAASGMNVLMVSSFLFTIVSIFLRRQVAVWATISGILLYAVLSGLEPSIIRASIMGSLVYVAQASGRQNYTFLSLFVAAFLMLVVSPPLIGDLGFQLSFLSTVGILVVKPAIDRGIGVLGGMTGMLLKGDFSTTVAAQLTTVPILLSVFSVYSAVSIVVNLLVLWTIPFLMVVGLVAACVSFIHPIFSVPLLYSMYPFVWFFERVVGLFAQMVPPIEVGEVPMAVVMGYYLILIGGVWMFGKRREREEL